MNANPWVSAPSTLTLSCRYHDISRQMADDIHKLYFGDRPLLLCHSGRLGRRAFGCVTPQPLWTANPSLHLFCLTSNLY